MDVTLTHYEVLGVTSSATAAEIKTAYRRMLRQTHPDTGGNVGLFRLVQDSYDVLSDEHRRRTYDMSLQRQNAQTSPTFDESSPGAQTWEEAFTWDEGYSSGKTAYEEADDSYVSSEGNSSSSYASSSSSEPTKNSKRTWTELGLDLQPQEDKVISFNYIVWFCATMGFAIIGYYWGASSLWNEWNADNDNGVAGFFAFLVALVPGVIFGVGGYGIGFALTIVNRLLFFFYKFNKYLRQ